MDFFAFFDRIQQQKHLESVDYKVDIDGVELDVRYTAFSQSNDLVLTFHGAVARSRRTLPTFSRAHHRLIAGRSEIQIADPTLPVSETLSVAWYTGSESIDSQTVIKKFIDQIKKTNRYRKRIYFGTSAGGFAALYFSFFDPGSYVVVVNPQTSVESYDVRIVARYIRDCWPGAGSVAGIPDRITTVLSQLYREPFSNLVVYVQSLGDRVHCQSHMAPFVHVAGRTAPEDRFVLQTEFWGHVGHSKAGIDPYHWMDAITHFDGSPTMVEVIQKWHELRGAADQPGKIAARPASPERAAAANPRDLAISQKLVELSRKGPRA